MRVYDCWDRDADPSGGMVRAPASSCVLWRRQWVSWMYLKYPDDLDEDLNDGLVSTAGREGRKENRYALLRWVERPRRQETRAKGREESWKGTNKDK
jgi:hypothetical protein